MRIDGEPVPAGNIQIRAKRFCFQERLRNLLDLMQIKSRECYHSFAELGWVLVFFFAQFAAPAWMREYSVWKIAVVVMGSASIITAVVTLVRTKQAISAVLDVVRKANEMSQRWYQCDAVLARIYGDWEVRPRDPEPQLDSKQIAELRERFNHWADDQCAHGTGTHDPFVRGKIVPLKPNQEVVLDRKDADEMFEIMRQKGQQ